MFQGLLYIGFLLSFVAAVPTTTAPMKDNNSTTSTQSSYVTTASTNMTTTEVPTMPGRTSLLRWPNDISSSSHRMRGRIILANTRVEGSEEWGLTAEEAELACDRIARYQSELAPHTLLSAIMLRLFPKKHKPSSVPMEGHLLSIGSGEEVLAISRMLSPLPSGAYWTGGKLVRYRVNSMRRNTFKDHIVLTWSDGRVSRPSVLGMTKDDEEKLREGYTYCLALNLEDAAWQARDCSDLLPYACVITPRQVGFSNEAEKGTNPLFKITATTPKAEVGDTEKVASTGTTKPYTTSALGMKTTTTAMASTTTTTPEAAASLQTTVPVVTSISTTAAAETTGEPASTAVPPVTVTQFGSGIRRELWTTKPPMLSAEEALLMGSMNVTSTPTLSEESGENLLNITTVQPQSVSGHELGIAGIVSINNASLSTEPTNSSEITSEHLLEKTFVTMESGSPTSNVFTGLQNGTSVTEASNANEVTSAPTVEAIRRHNSRRKRRILKRNSS